MTTFSVLLAFGAVLGLIWIALEAPLGDRFVYLNAGFLGGVGALVGGRIFYVFFHWQYFQFQIIEITQVWLGGFSWPGALAGSLLAIVLVAWMMGIPLGFLSDGLMPLLASLSVTLWLACWLSGCAYGIVIDSWWGLSTQDEWGIWGTRLPLQLLGAILTVALFWGIDRFRHYRGALIPGLAACLSVGGLSLILLAASLLRADPYPLWNGIRLETWAALFFLGVAITAGVFAILMSRR